MPLVMVGCTLLFAGIWEFQSLRQVSGLEASGLVTTGIYRYSRNPQYLGWFVNLLGVSIMGRSMLALLYTIIGFILLHFYIVKMEEPYLKRIYGERYISYRSKVPRYLRLRKNKRTS